MNQKALLDRLAISDNPAIQYKFRAHFLQEDPASQRMHRLQSQIRGSNLVRSLLSERTPDGIISFHPYGKWYGSHWVLADLADLNYPPGDKSLLPLRAQEYDWLFSESHLETAPFAASRAGREFGNDRPRIHASMEGTQFSHCFVWD